MTRHTSHPEHNEQKEFFRIIRELRRLEVSAAYVTIGIPNAAKRGKHLSAYMKAEGLTAGVPDILCLAPGVINGKQYHGLAIEMKFGKNTSTPEQMDFQSDLSHFGWYVKVCYTAVEAFNIWAEYNELNSGQIVYINRKFCINGEGLFS
jgi:hypothetical protein